MKKKKRKQAKHILIPITAAVLVASGFTPVMGSDKAKAATYIDTTGDAEFIASGKDPNFNASQVNNSNFNFTLKPDGSYKIKLAYGRDNIAGIHIPATYNGQPITEIDSTAFFNLKGNLYFEDSSLITKINTSGFQGTKATNSLSFPNIKEIGSSAFSNTTFKNIYISRDVEKIDSHAFSNTAATNPIAIPKILELDSAVFMNAKFKEIELNSNMRKIGSHSLSGTNNKDVYLPYLTEIPSSSFQSLNLERFGDFGEIKAIGDYAFSGVKSTEPVNFERVDKLGNSVFSYSKFPEINLGDSSRVESIGVETFKSTVSTSKLNLPSVKHIGKDAFNATKFSRIALNTEELLSIGDYGFSGIDSTAISPDSHIRLSGDVVLGYGALTFNNTTYISFDGVPNLGSKSLNFGKAKLILLGVPGGPEETYVNARNAGQPDVSKQIYGFQDIATWQSNYVNTPPHLTGIPNITVKEGELNEVSLVDYFTDVNDDALRFKVTSNSLTNEQLNLKATSIETSKMPLGTHTLNVIANDGFDDSVVAIFNITVKSAVANTPPTFTQIPDQTLTVGEQKTLNLTSYFKDAELDKLTFTANSPTVSLENLPLVNGVLDFSKIQEGEHIVTIKANDGEFDSPANTFKVTVASQVNNKPDSIAIPNQVVTVGEQKSLDIKPYFIDKDSDTLTYTATSEVPLVFSNGVLDMSNLSVGIHTIEVKANDGKVDSDVITFTVEVNEVASSVKPPTLIGASPHTVTINMTKNPEGKTFNLSSYFKADSNEASQFKVLGVDASEHFEFELDSTTGILNVKPLSVGTETIQVYAENSAGMSTPLAVNVNITETSAELPPPTSVTKPIDPLTMEQVYYLESGQTIQVPISRLLIGLTGEPTIQVNSSTPSATTADTTLVDSSLTMTLQGINNGFGYHEVLASDTTGLTNSLSVSAVVSKSNFYIDENGQTQIRDAEINADESEVFVVPLDQVFGTVGVVDEFEYLFEIQKKSVENTTAKYMNLRIASLNSLFATAGTQTPLPSEINASNIFSDGNISVDLAGHNLIVSGTNMSDYNIQVGTNIAGTTSMKPFNVKVNSSNNNGGTTTPDNGGNNGGTTTPDNGGNNGGTTTPDNGGNGGTDDGSSQPSTGVGDVPNIDLIFEGEDDKIKIIIDESKNLESVNELTIKGDGIYVTINGKEQKVSDAKNDLDFSKLRVIRDNDNAADSTVMHYTTESSLVITSKNLKNLYITSTVPVPFTDIKNNQWYQYKEIEDLYNYLIVKGTTATTYSPKASITRSEFAVMVARALELTSYKTDTSYSLRDLDGNWYAEDIQALVNLGIIEGFSDGTFGGSKELSRQQAAVIISRMLEYLNVDMHTTKDIKFADMQKISDYAKDSVNFLAQNNILVNGENVNFNPHNDLTRDHMAKVLAKALRLSDFY